MLILLLLQLLRAGHYRLWCRLRHIMRVSNWLKSTRRETQSLKKFVAHMQSYARDVFPY